MEPRKVYVAGGHATKFTGKGDSKFVKGRYSIGDYMREAVQGALRDAGVEGSDVDRVFVGNAFGELLVQQGHLGAAAVGAAPEGLRGKPSVRFEAACASGGVAFEAGVQAVRSGIANVVLVVGAEVETTLPSRRFAAALATASDHPRQHHIDPFVWPAVFAARAERYFRRHPQPNDLHLASFKALANARLNPLAQLHENAISSPEELLKSPTFLQNPRIKEYCKLADCSACTDGAAAVVLTSRGGEVEVLSSVVAVDDLYAEDPSFELHNMKRAADLSYRAAGISPRDIDVAEVHDCFTIAEVLSYEALGFAPVGQGLSLLRSGTTSLTGNLPVNTGGGLIGFGHPVGATGVKQVLEIYRQMQGKCGGYQLPDPASRVRYGVAANMGGDDKTAVVSIFKNCRTPAKL